MKKNAVVLFFLAVMFFAITAAASAQVVLPTPIDPVKDPYGYASKQDYYLIIDNRLTIISEALANKDLEKAQNTAKELRMIIYRCAQFLAGIQEYDSRILYVSANADKALEADDYNSLLSESRKLAYEILMGVKPVTPYTPGGYVPGAGDGAGEGDTEGGEEEESGGNQGGGKHS